ncbi:ABC transporter permease [Methylobacterium terricola]|uniref:ABC transporter permease n=1 Tax=Methylobacterium terricola TaxID=2583531 RepID=A0A5C4LJN3_9HYPH|nr:ABC transporter permease [Methylobacterium terricola]TNC14493.1 ABC transporter permease [Methylobacterium terricola]
MRPAFLSPQRSFKPAMTAGCAAAFAMVLAPLVAIIWVSFFDNKIISFPPKGYTLAWYAAAWDMPRFRDGFVTSLELGAVATLVSLLVGVPASLVLARGRFRGREVVQSLLMAPLIVPGIVAGAAFYMLLIEFEVLTGIQIATTFTGLAIAHSLIALPWTIRLVTASLLGVDSQLAEAALTMGARPLTVFRRVTWPVIRPGVVAGALFSFVISFVDLEKSLFLVGPGTTTLPIVIVNYLEWSVDPTIAAVATVQILLIAAGLVVTNRYFRLTRAF